MSVDPTWLAAAVYPVYVDPSISNGGTDAYGDTFGNRGDPTHNYANYQRPDSPNYYEMWLGESPNPTTDVAQDFIKFDLSTIAGTTIDSATLNVFPYHEYYQTSDVDVWVREVTGPWTESGLTYNSEPGHANGVSGTTRQYSYSAIDVTAMVQRWNYGRDSNYGFELDENGHDYTYWRRLISSEEGADYPHPPKLVVTNHVPVASTTTDADGWTSNRALTWTVTPNAQTEYEATVATDSSFAPEAIVVTSGQVSDTSARAWTIPENTTLVDGTSYAWRVRVYDGTTWSSWAVGTFNYDASFTTTGIDPNAETYPDPSELGFTQADIDTKNAVYANFLGLELQGDDPDCMILEGGGGDDGINDYDPEGCPNQGNPIPSTTLNITMYYQQTTSWCLEATVETLLHYKYGGYVGTGTLADLHSWQQTASSTIQGAPREALHYFNTKRPANSTWHYAYKGTDSSAATFKKSVKNEILSWAMPLFVRVDYGDHKWPGYIPGSSTHHATAAVGFSSGGTVVQAYDPIAHMSGGTCIVHPYQPNSVRYTCSHTMSISD